MTDSVSGVDLFPPVPRLASRISRLGASVVREILQAAASPDMISFAGGLPAPETIPALSAAGVPSRFGQYGLTEGEPELRAALADYLGDIGLECPPERVLVLSGSQQGIDLVSKLFIDEGTRLLVESPTYIAALQSFRLFGADLLGVPLGARGLDAAALDGALAMQPSLAYLVPTFQNPTGYCYDDAARDALARRLDEAGVPLFEDDPYRELSFDAPAPRPMAARLRRSPWIFQSSFSKRFVPGVRIGFLAASESLFPHLVRLKQAADLHTNRLGQWLALEALRSPDEKRRLQATCAAYAAKRDAFDAALNRHFGDIATWTKPAGGLFFWVRLHRPLDLVERLGRALEDGVAYVPGEACFPESPPEHGYLRLNFSHTTPERADEGLRRLAAVCR